MTTLIHIPLTIAYTRTKVSQILKVALKDRATLYPCASITFTNKLNEAAYCLAHDSEKNSNMNNYIEAVVRLMVPTSSLRIHFTPPETTICLNNSTEGPPTKPYCYLTKTSRPEAFDDVNTVNI